MNTRVAARSPVSNIDRLAQKKRQTRSVTVIQASNGLFNLDLQALWEYRDLFYFLVWRDIKTRYAQSILGIGWAVIQPVFSMLVFTVIFGRLAKITSDGLPYAIFSYAALVPWTFFSNSVSDATGSLIKNANMLQKIYFPRLIIPMTSVLGKLIDFCIALFLLFLLMFWFRIPPTIWVLMLPFLVLIMILSAAGLGMWLTALSIQYRDINYGKGFVIQLLMYSVPVVYPTSMIPEQYRLLYGLNPMVGVIEGFRSSLLGARPMPWDLITIGTISAIILFFSGMFFFRYKERTFADVA